MDIGSEAHREKVLPKRKTIPPLRCATGPRCPIRLAKRLFPAETGLKSGRKGGVVGSHHSEQVVRSGLCLATVLRGSQKQVHVGPSDFPGFDGGAGDLLSYRCGGGRVPGWSEVIDGGIK